MKDTSNGVGFFRLNTSVFLALSLAVITLGLFNCKSEERKHYSHRETERIDSLLTSASYLIVQEQYDSARQILDMKRLALLSDCQEEEAFCIRRLYLLGKSYYEEGAYQQARLYFDKGAKFVKTINEDYEHDMYMSLKTSYFYMLDNSNCLAVLMEYMTKSDTTIRHFPPLAEVYLELAHLNNIKVVRSKYDTTVANESRRLIAKANKYLQEQDVNLSFRAWFYDVWTSPIDINDRILKLKTAEPLSEDLSPIVKAEYVSYLRALYFQNERRKEHIEYAHKYIEFVDQMSSPRQRNALKLKGFSNLAASYMGGDYELALTYMDSAYNYADYIPYKGKIALSHNRVASMMHLGYPQDSVLSGVDRAFVEIRDWFENKSDNEMVALMRRQEENLLLHQEKSKLHGDKLLLQRNLVILIACFGLLVAFFYYRMYKKQMTINNLQNKVVSGQLNPHFIGNAIYATMLMVEEAVPQAYTYLSKLHKFIRYLFLNYRKDFISLHKEVDMLSNYIALEASKRKSSKLLFSYHIPEQLDHKEVLIMPMLLQPLVENAVKFSDANSDNHIHLSFEVVSKDILKCVISDKGRGITEEVTQFPEGHSLYYIKAYSDLVTRKQSLILKPNAASKGTKAELLVKYRKGI